LLGSQQPATRPNLKLVEFNPKLIYLTYISILYKKIRNKCSGIILRNLSLNKLCHYEMKMGCLIKYTETKWKDREFYHVLAFQKINSIQHTYLMFHFNIYSIHKWQNYTITLKIFIIHKHIHTYTFSKMTALTWKFQNHFICKQWCAGNHVNKSGKISATGIQTKVLIHGMYQKHNPQCLPQHVTHNKSPIMYNGLCYHFSVYISYGTINCIQDQTETCGCPKQANNLVYLS
jgi:hypothetical protein